MIGQAEAIRLVPQRSSSVYFALGPSQATSFFDRLGTDRQTGFISLMVGAESFDRRWEVVRPAVVKVILDEEKGIKHASQAPS